MAIYWESKSESTAGKGIDFSNASGSHAGSTGSVLDDYEEGNIQSFFEVAGIPKTVTSFTEKSAFYVKIGNVCHVFYSIDTGSVNIGSGNITLVLPFQASSKNHSQGIYTVNNAGSVQYNWWWRVEKDATEVDLFAGINTSGRFQANGTDRREIRLCLTYNTV